MGDCSNKYHLLDQVFPNSEPNERSGLLKPLIINSIETKQFNRFFPPEKQFGLPNATY